MTLMTEEEGRNLDELLTRTTPEVDPSVKGVTSRKGFKMVHIDDFTAEYITSKALAIQQTPEQIIHEFVQKELVHS